MLQAFVDDSIARSGERRLYLGTYVQTATAWAEFSDVWDSECRADPPIAYFKMSEAHGRRGEFRRFSEKQRNRKVFAFANVIRRFAPWGFHSSVSVADFDRIVKPHAPHPMATPYFELCYAVMFGVARRHSDLQVKVPCDFIFDEHDGLPAKVLPVFEAMRSNAPKEWRGLIGGAPIFRDDKNMVPLQAADMLVWHVRRENEGNYPREYDGLLDLIIVDGVHSYTEITSEILEGQAEFFKSVSGAGITRKVWDTITPLLAGQPLPDRFLTLGADDSSENPAS